MIKLLDNQTIHSTASDNLLSTMILNKDVHSVITNKEELITDYKIYFYNNENDNN